MNHTPEIAPEPDADLAEPPNQPEDLYSGPFRIAQGRTRIMLEGTVSLHWTPSPEVRFRGQCSRGEGTLELNAAHLTTGNRGLRGRALILNHSPRPPQTVYEGIVNPEAIAGIRRPVKEIRFQLLNFLHYVGDPVSRGPKGSKGWARARIAFPANDWMVTLDEVRDSGQRLKKVRARGGFATTHLGHIKRRSGAPVTFNEAFELLSALNLFFGFLGGQWVGPVLATGHGSKGVIWRQFASWRVMPGRSPRSWFPHHHGSDVSGLLEPFLRRYQHDLWRRAIRTLIHWYVHASSKSGTTEAAIISAAIPLELLSWLVVVEDGEHMSARKFDDLSFASRITELLVRSGVPVNVPKELRRLSGSALMKNRKTGPECLAMIRHALIHPKRARRARLSALDPLVLFELKELGMTYIELAFLHALGYKRRYARRMFDGWKGQDLATVPWA